MSSEHSLKSPKAVEVFDPPRTCKGVPGRVGASRIECGAVLPQDRFVVCERCDAEIEHRQTGAERRNLETATADLLRHAGLSEPFVTRQKSLDTVRPLTPQHTEAIQAARNLVLSTPGDGNTLGLLLRGDPGVGKSDIAEGVIQAAVLCGHSGRYVNARELALNLQASFRDDAPEPAARIIDRYTNPETARFLAVDDLGATKPTRLISDAFYLIFERRARNRMPTFVATNYVNLADLAERLRPSDGDDLDTIRPVDRLRELCPISVTIHGESQRARVSTRLWWEDSE